MYDEPAMKGDHKKMSAEEMKMRGKADLHTLVTAEEIKADKERMKMAMACRKEQMEAMEKVKANG